MLTFKTFVERYLIEGGNLVIPDPLNAGKKLSSTPIKAENRSQITQGVHDMLHGINQEHIQNTGNHLFGPKGEGLNSGKAYQGSTRSFMDQSIPNDRYKKVKPTTGDIDVAIPHEHRQTLAKQLEVGKKYGPYTVAGTKNSGNQLHAIMKHDSGDHHQIDFEPSDYEGGNEPSPWQDIGHGSNFGDMESGIKGAHAQKLRAALGAANQTQGLVQKSLRGKVVSTDVQPMNQHTFSVDKGLRSTYKQVGIDPLTKKPIHQELKPAEADVLPPEQGGYDKNIPTVMKKLFGKTPTKEEQEHFKSFHGILNLMKTHHTPEQQKNVIKKYTTSMLDPKANPQVIDNDMKKDKKMRMASIDHLRNAFPEHFSPEDEENIKNQSKEYYDPTHKRWNRTDGED